MAIKYKWLSGRLKELISKDIEKGINKLPTEKELCQRYKVSRQTVRQSLAMLEQEGIIEKRRGSGTYITGLYSAAEKNVIGVLISSDSEYIYPRVLHDIHTTLVQNGFTERIFVTGSRTHTERTILEELLEEPPRGLIVEGCKSALPNPNLDLYRKLRKKGCHILFLHNYYPALEDSLYIKDDNLAGSAMLVEHLVRQGHTAIAGIFKIDEQQGIERFQGYTEAMRDARLPIPDEWIGWFDSHDLDRLQRFHDTTFLKKIVQESLDSCTAVICYNDMISHFLIRELNLAGYHLPEDMALAAFDNTYLSSSATLALTTLAHKPHEMGTKAAQMMVNRLKGLLVTPQEVPWTLIPKESTPEHTKKD